MMHSRAVPPGRRHAAIPSTKTPRSATQFNPPKFDSTPSNGPSVASSPTSSARNAMASMPRRTATSIIPADASVASTSTPRSRNHAASTPVPQLTSRIRLPAGHNASSRRHTAARTTVPIALLENVSS